MEIFLIRQGYEWNLRNPTTNSKYSAKVSSCVIQSNRVNQVTYYIYHWEINDNTTVLDLSTCTLN